jgi:uncharacterized cupin superfamily protein
MKRFLSATLMLASLTTTGAARAETIKPFKASKSDLVGAIFNREGAVKQGKSVDVVTFASQDTAYQTGVYKSGPLREKIKGPQGLPYNEFMYFLSGSAKLTSADGSVMVVNAGETVTLPKGWTGHFDTTGYTKLYVTYNPDDVKK